MWIVKPLAALLAVPAFLIALLLVTAAHAADARLRTDGTRFALTLADGSVLHSEDLVGAELQMASGLLLRIDAVERRADPRGQPLWLHSISVRDAAGGWSGLCLPHADGTRLAMPVPGRERADASIADDAQGWVLACTAGALGKCLRAGYHPWEPGQRATYNACVRMFRGDYGGDGQPHTENGRQIDIYDDQSIQRPELLPSQRFEAGWSEEGAVCVHHPRVAHKVSLAEVEARYPRLRGRVGAICTEDFARAHGAQVFNRSDAH